MTLQVGQRYRLIVDRVEAFVSTQVGEPLHIDGLCLTCGITERALRNAFRAIYGLTPYRCLRAKRMQQARAALLAPLPSATVTSIATHFGFLELGRFSIEYRAAFGERPSETLRKARAVQCNSRQSRVEGPHLVFHPDHLAISNRHAQGNNVSELD